MANPKKPESEEIAEPDPNADPAKEPKLLVSATEAEGARARARKKFLDEQKAKAVALIEKEEYHRMLAEAAADGLSSDETQLIDVLIDLPDPSINSCLTINFNRRYYHGQIVKVPVHEARSINEMMFRLHYQSAQQIHGKPLRDFYRTKRDTIVGPHGVVNAPQRIA